MNKKANLYLFIFFPYLLVLVFWSYIYTFYLRQKGVVDYIPNNPLAGFEMSIIYLAGAIWIAIFVFISFIFF